MAEMTPRERFRAILKGEKPDRIPTDYQATAEVSKRLRTELGCKDSEALYRKLHIDGRRGIGPRWKLAHHPDDDQADRWGVRRTEVNYGTGAYEEVTHHPLAEVETVEQVHAFRWPSADDWDYSPVGEQLAKDDGYRIISAMSYEPFLVYCWMRGLERSYEDLAIAPDVAEAILGHLFDYHYEVNRRTWELGQGKVELTYVAEDLGSQVSPLMSLEMYRRYLRPNQKKMADLARSYGIHIMYHTDGAARIFLPDLINVVGIEMLNPVQWRCPGMEREGLVRDFGDKIIFHGSIDNQQTLPFGSVQDVVNEVKESIEIYKPARWICAPCHNLQPVSPTANIVAMYETIHELGRLA